MTTQEYFKIGSEVKYLRHDTELKVFQERGIVRAIFIDPNDRLMAQVKNGDNAYNVHYSTLNYEQSMVKPYKDLLQDIRGTSDEGDLLVQEIVDQYNLKVQIFTTALLGEPLVLHTVETKEKAA